MVVDSIIRYLLTDGESLARYKNGEFPAHEDIKLRMLLKAREHNRNLPDHYYRLAQDASFLHINSIAETLTTGINNISKKYLQLTNNKIYVAHNKQNDWQELITYMPPLLLQMSYLYYHPDLTYRSDSVIDFYLKYILPNTKYTAIPSPKIPQLDYYVNEQNGLHDLHMHLNGALETDQVWQDYLRNPVSIYNDLSKAWMNPKVKEQLEQESQLLNPSTYLQLLKAGKKLRRFFFEYLFLSSEKKEAQFQSKENMLSILLDEDIQYNTSYVHPFAGLVTDRYNHNFSMSIEGLMYIKLIDELENNKNEALAGFFHFYLLILGLTNRLLVQQTHQYGFEQFQKHTLNGLREESERKYVRRYFQMQGNDLRNIKFLEGRFSPKDTDKEMKILIHNIFSGWNSMLKTISEEKNEMATQPQLKLIAHFIKKKDNNKDPFIRYRHLRFDLWKRAKVLALLIKNTNYKDIVRGIDAAASEFDTPPEVFAPVFRFMRKSGIEHFTYHAGEDFYHLLSGLRAIYEAVVFCGLKHGDRIGHATASGISSKQWLKEIGSKMLIRKGEYMDNLIFCHHLITSQNIESLHKLLPFIASKIEELSADIYGDFYSIAMLEKGWLTRQCCPFHVFNQSKENNELYFESELGFKKQFFKDHGIDQDGNIRTLIEKYHGLDIRKKYDEIIYINPESLISGEEMELLQLALLNYMCKNEIVIETLPTSNIRIGIHRSFETYHLWNWLKWREEGKSIPPIIVGSDDTGIFATNIYNEYANIYCFLLNHIHLPHDKIMNIIRRLDEDSHVYRFD